MRYFPLHRAVFFRLIFRHPHISPTIGRIARVFKNNLAREESPSDRRENQ
jgi:hypothetical protein